MKSSRRDELTRIAATGAGFPRRTFGALVQEAAAFRTAVAATVATGVAASGGQAHGRDALLLGVDILRDPLTVSDTEREALLEAIARAYPNSYADPEVVASQLEAMSEASVAGVMNAVQGAMFELRVAEMLDAGDLPLPDGAVAWEQTDFTYPGADGQFLDADGEVVGVFQIKASADDGIIHEHLERYPDITEVVTTTEAAEAAGGLDGVTDSGIRVEDLLPGDSAGEFVEVFSTSFLENVGEVLDDFPILTLGLIAAEVAATRLRGGDMQGALTAARSRAGRALTWSALGTGAALATGLQPARLVVTVGGRAASGWVSRAARDQAATVAHLRRLQERLAPLRPAPAG